MKRNPNMLEILLVALGCAAVLALVFFVVVPRFSYQEINLADLTEATFEGYDSEGTATISLNVPEGMEDFFDTVQLKADNLEGLSNGDSIHVTYQYSEDIAKDNRIHVSGLDDVIEVNGLTEYQTITEDEIFEAVQVSFAGVSPYIEVSVENISSDPLLSGICFSAGDEGEYYSGGDTVTVTAVVDESAAHDSGAEFDGNKEVYEREYTVPEGESYVTDPSDITPDMLQQYIDRGISLMDDQSAREYGLRIYTAAGTSYVFVNKQTTFVWKNPVVLSAYFHVLNSGAQDDPEKHFNDVMVCYEATLYQQVDGASVQAEIIVRFEGLTRLADGTVNLNLDSGKIVSASYNDSEVKAVLTDSSEDYDTTRLELP